MASRDAQQPLVSVVLPVRNGMPYLREAVESMLAQTLREIEILIVDDGSTDDTPLYCRSIDDPRVRIIRLEAAGLVNALNTGLREARSDVIARMDADDASLPERLEKQFAMLRRDGLVLLSCQFDKIDVEGRVVGHVPNLLADAAIRWRLLFTPAFVHPGAMFLKDAAIRAGEYSAEFRVAQDYDLWTRLAALGRMSNHPETLLRYRVLPTSTSATNRESQIGNASKAAARYAHKTCAAVSENEWYHLHRYSTVGELPAGLQALSLARVFASVREAFLQRFGTSCDELNASIAGFGQHLRWRCLRGAGRLSFSRFHAIRAARLFDPAGSSLWSVGQRKVASILRGSTRQGNGTAWGPVTACATVVSNDHG